MKKLLLILPGAVLMARLAVGQGQPMTNQILSSAKNIIQKEGGGLQIILDPLAKPALRLKAVHRLGCELDAQAVAMICRFMTSAPNQREANMPALQLLKNDLLNVLMQQ